MILRRKSFVIGKFSLVEKKVEIVLDSNGFTYKLRI